MDWDIIAPLIGGVSIVLITALTILLWPLSRRLANLVEVVIQEKSRRVPLRDASFDEALLRIDSRLSGLEEELRFAAALNTPRPDAVTPYVPRSEAESRGPH